MRLVSASEHVSDGKSPLIGVTVALDATELCDLEAASLDHLHPTVLQREGTASIVLFTVRAPNIDAAVQHVGDRLRPSPMAIDLWTQPAAPLPTSYPDP